MISISKLSWKPSIRFFAGVLRTLRKAARPLWKNVNPISKVNRLVDNNLISNATEG
jgi:hypothetical protein